MEFLKDRRVVLALGALAAIILGAVIALAIGRGSRPADEPPPASQGGLVVQPGVEDTNLDPARPLRCFVDGQYVGELTLAVCAERNGVATGALDVGVDETGALAAAGSVSAPTPPMPTAPAPSQPVQPPPQQQAQAPVQPAPTPAPTPAADGGACWSFAGGSWSRLPENLSLNGCVQRLFAGNCVRFGQAEYGRWGQQTLRLVRGRVEISDDNRRFRTLARQDRDCSIEAAG